jgi:hypothetical protein
LVINSAFSKFMRTPFRDEKNPSTSGFVDNGNVSLTFNHTCKSSGQQRYVGQRYH